jgi:hypothetical protein
MRAAVIAAVIVLLTGVFMHAAKSHHKVLALDANGNGGTPCHSKPCSLVSSTWP